MKGLHFGNLELCEKQKRLETTFTRKFFGCTYSNKIREYEPAPVRYNTQEKNHKL